MDGSTAPQLFQGKFAQIPMPDGAPADEAGPDGYYYSPQKLAERYGFKGFSWKALAVGCKADTYFYFPDRNTALFPDRGHSPRAEARSRLIGSPPPGIVGRGERGKMRFGAGMALALALVAGGCGSSPANARSRSSMTMRC